MTPFLDVAGDIAERISSEAVWDDGRCTWLTWPADVPRSDAVPSAPAGGDVYSGASGIAWFLARCSVATGRSEFADVARGGARHSLRVAQMDRPVPGFHEGTAGQALAVAEVGSLVGDPLLMADALTLGREAGDRLAGSQSSALDVTSGLSGTALGLLRLGRRHDEPRLVRDALRCGETISSGGVPAIAGRAFPGPGEPAPAQWGLEGMSRFLGGYAHGAAGIAHVLAELAVETRSPSIESALDDAVLFEDSWFDRAQSNWPDLRWGPPEPGAPFAWPVAWCHGAAGIGLSRVRAFELLRRDRLAADAGAALAAAHGLASTVFASAQRVTQHNFSLCHGLAGVADFLLEAARVFEVEEHRRSAVRIGRIGADQAERGLPWSCGTVDGAETPGLMLGLAGIGALYLRLHDPTADGAIGLGLAG